MQIRHLLDDAADQSDTRLVPLIWLGVLAGVLPRNVATALRLLRWMARLAGDTLTAVDLEIDAADRSAVAGHSLLLGRRLAELEHELDELTDHVALLLPLWQTEAGCGSATWIDLAAPPAEISAEQLQRVDHFLLLLAADLDSPPVTPPVLTYACPRGALHTTQRLLGFPQGIAAAIEHIRRHLEIFRQRLADVYDSAVETGDGFLVETGLSRLRPDEESFITLGTVLGFWRWCGPASATAAYQVDLLSLADCPTVAAQASSWSLVARLYEESIGTREIPSSSWPRRSAPVLAPGSDEEPRWTRHVRALLPSSERDDDLRQARRRIKGLVEGDTASQLLVLRGLAGTGRHRVVLEGLFGPGRSDREIPEITFYCPDRATAALITSEATAQGLAWPLDIRIPGRGDPVSGLRRSGRFLADLHRPVVVMCEIQRFEPELRYRIAQSARGGCLVMTVDVAATAEPWENLFLTTPRADDVVVLERQQRLTRQLWTELRQLVPEVQRGDAASRRKEKGQLQAAYAANLDQGLAHIYSEYEAQRLPDRLRLVAALESDLEYLGASLRSHGWLALSAEQLESMLLPGAMEFLAAVTDVLAAAGYLNRFFAGQAADPQDRADDNEPDVTELEARGESLLRCLLDDVSYDRWLRWCADRDLDMSRLTVRGFLDLIAEADWASHSLAQPASQRRVRALVEAWGDEPLTGLVESTSWEAWWYTARDLAGLTGPAACRPLVQLTTATAAPGPYVAGGIYLCLGTETAASHYRVMNRVTDGLLVLFQERSPLPSQTTE